MAIAFSTGDISNSNVASFSHDCGSGDDRFLVVNAGRTGNKGPSARVTSATYNSVTMTREFSELFDNSGGFKSELATFILPSNAINTEPASGVNTLSVSYVAGNEWISVATYTGVDQTTPIETSSIGSGSNFFTHPTTVTDTDNWLIGGALGIYGSGLVMAAGAGTTLREVHDGGGVDCGSLDSGGSIGASGSQYLTFTGQTGSGVSAVGVMSVNAAAGGGGGATFVPIISMMT